MTEKQESEYEPITTIIGSVIVGLATSMVVLFDGMTEGAPLTIADTSSFGCLVMIVALWGMHVIETAEYIPEKP